MEPSDKMQKLVFWSGLAYIVVLVLALVYAMQVGAQGVDTSDAEAWYEVIVDWAIRPGVTAIVAGIVLAFVIPQRVKMDFPPEWPDHKRRVRTRLTSFLSGFIGTAALWPIGWDWMGMHPLDRVMVAIGGMFAALVVGASAPFTYTVIVRWLQKRGYWTPTSGEEHAERRRMSTGTSIEPEE